MKKIIFASKNQGKVNEVKAMLSSFDVEVLSLNDVGYDTEIVEDSGTFVGNARIKAETIAKEFGLFTIADDSGLEIESLNQEPGVDTAIYAGVPKSDEKNMAKVINKMLGIPECKRGATFKCVLIAIDKQGNEYIAEGECKGRILTEKKGSNGHGYDPIFFVPQLNLSMAEMTSEQKNEISHRRRAFDKLSTILSEIL